MTFEQCWQGKIRTGFSPIFDPAELAIQKEIFRMTWNAAIDAAVKSLQEGLPVMDSSMDVVDVKELIIDVGNLKANK